MNKRDAKTVKLLEEAWNDFEKGNFKKITLSALMQELT